jgi:AcrR family transcriptional regulator
MSKQNTRRPRLAAPLRKSVILDAAIELFSSNGFRGTTTRELAAAVGVSEPVLYQHFSTKRDLYSAILERQVFVSPAQLERELETYSKAGDNRSFFTRLARMGIDWYCDDPRYARLLMFSALERHELSDLFYERHVAVFYRWVTRHLNRQMRRGGIRKVNALLAARSFAGMIVHHGLIFAVLRPGEMAGSRQQIVDTVVGIFLNGLSLEGGDQ